MRKCIIIASFLVLISVLYKHVGACPPVCCGGGQTDWIAVTILNEGPRQPSGGFVHIKIDLFVTTADGCQEPIEIQTVRDCWEETPAILGGAYSKSGACHVICGDWADCPNNIACDCGVVTHGCGWFDQNFPLWGKGELKLFFKGNLVWNYPFDYPENGEPELEFTDIRFLNKDGSAIVFNDIFDVYETVSLRVTANFTGEEPPAE